jgi:hypothetical protein
LALPTDNRIGLHDHQRRHPSLPHSSEPTPEQTVEWVELRPLGPPLQDEDLLP